MRLTITPFDSKYCFEALTSPSESFYRSATEKHFYQNFTSNQILTAKIKKVYFIERFLVLTFVVYSFIHQDASFSSKVRADSTSRKTFSVFVQSHRISN